MLWDAYAHCHLALSRHTSTSLLGGGTLACAHIYNMQCLCECVNVDMNLNVYIMPHRHLRELRAISVLFVTVKFRLPLLLRLLLTTLNIL